MEPTTSELVLSIVQQIAHDVQEIKNHIRDITKKVPAQEILDPGSYVLYVHNEPLDVSFLAQATLHVLPTSKMSGERKTMTDASYICDSSLLSNIKAIGAALNLVVLQRPDNLIIRTGDRALVTLLNNGSIGVMSTHFQEKIDMLRADLSKLGAIGREGIKVKVEWVDPDGDPHWNDIQTLIYTARKQYSKDISQKISSPLDNNSVESGCQKETANASSIGNSKDI